VNGCQSRSADVMEINRPDSLGDIADWGFDPGRGKAASGAVGTTPDDFSPILRDRSPEPYGNAEMALSHRFRLPLRTSYAAHEYLIDVDVGRRFKARLLAFSGKIGPERWGGKGGAKRTWSRSCPIRKMPVPIRGQQTWQGVQKE
jgi:hypothetical protein